MKILALTVIRKMHSMNQRSQSTSGFATFLDIVALREKDALPNYQEVVVS